MNFSSYNMFLQGLMEIEKKDTYKINQNIQITYNIFIDALMKIDLKKS
jgi:hypothetical protein